MSLVEANLALFPLAVNRYGRIQVRLFGSRGEPDSDNPGGLKGSTQHWLAVYPPGFESPTFVAGAD